MGILDLFSPRTAQAKFAVLGSGFMSELFPELPGHAAGPSTPSIHGKLVEMDAILPPTPPEAARSTDDEVKTLSAAKRIQNNLNRADKPLILAYFSGMERSLAHDVRHKVFDHSTNKGNITETMIRQFIESLVGFNAVVSSGEIFSEDTIVKDSRHQLDVIVSIPHLPPLPSISTERFVLREAVLAIFEVKTTLSAQNLKEASNRVAELRKKVPEGTILGIIGFNAINPSTGRANIQLIHQWLQENRAKFFDFVLILNYGIWVTSPFYEYLKKKSATLKFNEDSKWIPIPRDNWKTSLVDLEVKATKYGALPKMFSSDTTPSEDDYIAAKSEYLQTTGTSQDLNYGLSILAAVLYQKLQMNELHNAITIKLPEFDGVAEQLQKLADMKPPTPKKSSRAPVSKKSSRAAIIDQSPTVSSVE